jgi:hypothetical protein
VRGRGEPEWLTERKPRPFRSGRPKGRPGPKPAGILAQAPSPRRGESFSCAHCGAPVREGSRACRECGSDAATGWKADAPSESLDLPESELSAEDYETFLARERLAGGRRRSARGWIAVLVLALAAAIAVFFSR